MVVYPTWYDDDLTFQLVICISFFPSKKEWTLPLGDLSAPERYRVAAGSVVMPGKAPFAYAKQHQSSPKHLQYLQQVLSSTSLVRTREVVTHPLLFANDADIGRVIICGIQYPSNYVIYIVYTVPRVWGNSHDHSSHSTCGPHLRHALKPSTHTQDSSKVRHVLRRPVDANIWGIIWPFNIVWLQHIRSKKTPEGKYM